MSPNHEASILEWQAAMEAGHTTSRELTILFLERIAAYDKQGPTINAISEINPDALHIAEALDRERAISGSRGPLHGIPILIKDNIATGDNMHTTAGCSPWLIRTRRQTRLSRHVCAKQAPSCWAKPI